MILARFVNTLLALLLLCCSTAALSNAPLSKKPEGSMGAKTLVQTSTMPVGSPETSGAPSDQKQLINGIVAIVNKTVVTRAQLNRAVDQMKMDARLSGSPLPSDLDISPRVLHHLLVRTAAMDMAQLNGINITHEQVDAAINKVLSSAGTDQTQLQAQLSSRGMTMEQYRSNIKDQLTINQLEQGAVANNVMVTEQEVRDYMVEHRGVAQSANLYDIAHILIAPADTPTPAQLKVSKEKAMQVYHEIKQGKITFKQAAIKYSAAADALKGGDLGLKPLSGTPTLFVKPVLSMKAGEILAPIQNDYGFHIIKLVAVKVQAQAAHFATQYNIRQISIKVTPITPSAKAKAMLLSLHAQLENGADFSQLAKANSQVFASTGGSAGWQNTDHLSPSMLNEAKELKTSAYSAPFENGKQWSIIKLVGERKVNDTQAYYENQARTAIFQEKAQKAVSVWESKLLSQAYVKILPKSLQSAMTLR